MVKNFIRKIHLCFIHGFRFPETDVRIPLGKAFASEVLLFRHKKRIILNPVSILIQEFLKGRMFLLLPSLKGLPENLVARVIEPSIVDPVFSCVLPRHRDILFPDQSLPHQLIRADKIRIPREGRKGLVGRISESRRSHRQNLPVFLTCFFQKIHEPVRLFREASDSVFPGKTEERHQYSACPHLLSSFPRVRNSRTPFCLYLYAKLFSFNRKRRFCPLRYNHQPFTAPATTPSMMYFCTAM